MIDLFGIGRSPEEPEKPEAGRPAPEPAPEPEDGKPSRGAHRVWAFLLVLDSVFVIVFGGVVAAKVYQYWKAPAPTRVSRPARRPPAAKPVPPPPSTAAPAPAAKPEAPASRAEKETTRARPASAAKKRVKAKSSPRARTAAKAPAAVHARPVVFRLHAPHARRVEVVGAFIIHGGGHMAMKKGRHGNWSVKLYLNPGQYRYLFIVDRQKILDPENPRSARGASLLNVP